jgi:hypothetical protein
MPPAYTVRAQVVDIRTDSPRPTDRFLVDTNVWAWKHYPGVGVSPSGVSSPQASDYPPYLDRTIASGATRYRTGLCLAELVHLIEKNEHDAYTAGVGPLSLKDYRHNLPSERARLVGEFQRAWCRIKADSEPLALMLDDATTDAALSRLATEPVDGYDLYMLEAMACVGVTQLLTDDGDFCCVPGIEVFTANPRVLAAARAQGHLAVRLP